MTLTRREVAGPGVSSALSLVSLASVLRVRRAGGGACPCAARGGGRGGDVTSGPTGRRVMLRCVCTLYVRCPVGRAAPSPASAAPVDLCAVSLSPVASGPGVSDAT